MELRIFAYGTLKQGFSNHASYCTGVLRICPARLRGRLFKLNSEIPVMTIPDEDVLVNGTSDIAVDMDVQEKFDATLKGRETRAESQGGSAWRTVYGELLIFDDPETRLPLLDGLEEFRPGQPSSYLRVLVPVTIFGGIQASAWTYIAAADPAGLEEYMGENWTG